MNDDELEEFRIELEDLREFKRVVLRNFAELAKSPVCALPPNCRATSTEQLDDNTVIHYARVYDKNR